MCQLVRLLVVVPQPAGGQAKRPVPVHSPGTPVGEPLHVGTGLHEELHFHLLELSRTEDEISGSDLVAKRLSDLGDSEWHFLPGRLLHVDEIHIRPLRRLGTQVDDGRGVFDRTHERLEHQVELSRLADRPFRATNRALHVRRSRRALDVVFVGAEPALARAALDERIGETADVAARFPHARVHQNGRVEPFDVVPSAHHVPPPPVLQVALELHAERPVVPHRAGAAINLGGLEDEPAPLA